MQSCGADTGNATARTESDIVHPVLQQLRLLIDEMALLKDDLGWSKKHANISMTFFFFFLPELTGLWCPRWMGVMGVFGQIPADSVKV